MMLSLLLAAAGVCYSMDRGERTAILSNDFGRLELSLKGAQIRSWVPRGGTEVLFRPADMAFRGTADNRGGIPVCWPWFGRNGEEGSLAHGFARYTAFEVRGTHESSDGTSIVLGLPPSDETRKTWPYDCDLEYTVELGRELRLKLETKNVGMKAAWITEGLHPYWKVSDRRKVAVTGLDGLPYCFADLGREATAKWKGDFIPATHYDHVFWRGDRAATVVDPGAGREIRVSGTGYNKYVIWTPPEFKAGDFENLMPENAFDFVCVEPATLFREDGYSLEPGKSHVTEVRVSCKRGASHLFGDIADADAYAGRHPLFGKAFEFLKRKDLAELAKGRYEIDGTNCWAMIQECELKPFGEENTYEAHRAFVDIQAPISGPETMGVGFTPQEAAARFNVKDDYVLFKAKGEARTLQPGQFAVFFPPDGAHAPNLSLSGPRPHRKLVIKVRW